MNRSIFSQESIIKYLLIFFPISLIIGPFLAEITMNFISLIFILTIIKNKNYKELNKSFLIYLIILYLIINFSAFNSIYFDKIIFKSLASFRFILFIFATFFFLNIYKSLSSIFLKFLSYILLIVIIDGFFQYYFGYNLLGFENDRHDRVSGFFGYKLILGTYLQKFLFLFLSLIFFHYKNLNYSELIFYIAIFFLGLCLIVFSGDRSPFYLTILFLILLALAMQFKFKKLIISLLIIFTTYFFLIDKNVYDRYVLQTIKQVNFQKIYNNLLVLNYENIFNSFFYYGPIFNTAHKAFLDKKILGHGPKTYRYFCSDNKYESFSSNKINLLDNQRIIFNVNRELGKVKILEIFITPGKKIEVGDPILTYELKKYFGLKTDIKEYLSDKNGIINDMDIIPNIEISNGRHLAKIDPENVKSTQIQKQNGCTTHPHNFLLQLLSEIGILGALFVFFGFIYFSYRYLRYFYDTYFFNKSKITNAELCLIIYFIITLFPFVTSGNFFNNWLNMISIIHISFYMFYKSNK